MKLKITSTGQPVDFVVDSSDLAKAIANLEQVTKFSDAAEMEKGYVIAVSKKKVYFMAYSPQTFVAVQVPAEDVSTGETSFCFNPSVILGLLKGRNAVTFAHNGSALTINETKGNYNCTLVTKPVAKDLVPRLNRDLSVRPSGTVLDTDTLESLREGIRSSELTNLYALNASEKSLLCYITLNQGRLSVDSFDNFHIAAYRAKVSSSAKFRLALPGSTFSMVEKFIESDSAEDANLDFSISAEGLTVIGQDFVLSLPSTQASDSNFAMVPSFLKTLKNPKVKFSLAKAAVATVSNMSSLASSQSATETARFEFKVRKTAQGGRIQLSINTDSGDVKDTIKADSYDSSSAKQVAFKVDPRMFLDLFRKLRTGGPYPVELFFSDDDEEQSSFFVTKDTLDSGARLTLLGTFHE